jgi:hypothetical protein
VLNAMGKESCGVEVVYMQAWTVCMAK